MRILQLTPRLPWPPRDGGRVAMRQITLGLLRAGAEVDVLSLNPPKHHASIEEARAALAPARVDAVDDTTSAILRPLRASLGGGPPFVVARFASAALGAALESRLHSEAYDVVHLESPFLLPFLDTIRASTRAVVALRAQNVEFRIWEGLAARERNPLRRLALRSVAHSLRAWERTQIPRCDALVAISDDDAGAFRRLGCAIPTLVLPCGVDIPAPAPPGDPASFCFVGSMGYLPNREAVEWICDTLWPLVVRAEPRARLTVGGSAFPVALRARLRRAGIPVVEDFEDLASFLAPFGALLAPVFSGSGMRVKVLEAMALGKPVIATPLGAGGVEAEPGRHLLVGRDAPEIASRIVECVRDPERARSAGAAARALVAERYDAGQLGRTLLDFYASILPRAS